ncbi:hypothetical protein F5Y15DRAFT_410556 [Xylariaceae sp. FL0016]|nr:hypothetical protein F5Y15DRAFT_410556 [Xylariaceae sp. FL0016]
MSYSYTPQKTRPPPGQQGSTPFRSASASRFRSSLVPMTRPSPMRSLNPSTKPSTALSTERDIFRTTTPRSTRTTKFAPSLPAEATKRTPAVRKIAAQKIVPGGMSAASSTELFKMRIPSPDPGLTGEALSKEVPDDPSRKGTVYADQFLAHKCPPHFDDAQRRQFFCILDLRRLKYAANEIFVRKDWKLNILNFAKEYDKSRALIMLRYGLYEFKNVKPTEEQLRKWRTAHNLPDPDPEKSGSTSRPSLAPKTSAPKRKADDELAPKDNTLMASSITNQNKRRNMASDSMDPVLNAPAPFKKSKRKVDETDEPDENQPVKLQKSTPNAASSKFESILNKAQSGATSPVKQPSNNATLFGAAKSSDASITNGNNKSSIFSLPPSGSVFGTGKAPQSGSAFGSTLSAPKPGSTPSNSAGNIFSYLSESSANSSGNERGNVDDGSESGSEPEQEQDNQDLTPNKGPSAAASTGTNTPPSLAGPSLFPTSRTGTPAPNIFGGLPSNNADQSAKGGLFGRVQLGANGQPLRATEGLERKGGPSPEEQSAAKKMPTSTPAKPPGDYTFNPATTPIIFQKPTDSTNRALSEEKTEPASGMTSAAPKSSSLIDSDAVQGKHEVHNRDAAVADNAATAKKPSALFGDLKKHSPAPQPPGLFGASTGSEAEASKKPAIGTPATSQLGLFGYSDTKPNAKPKDSGLFASTPETTSKPLAPSLFGKVPDQGSSPSGTSLFGATPAQNRSNGTSKEQIQNIFGATSNAKPAMQAQSPLGGLEGKSKPIETTDSSIFNNTPKPSTSTSFGAGSTSLFGSTKPVEVSATSSKSIFGATDEQEKPSSTGFEFGSSKSDSISNGPEGKESSQAPKTLPAPASTPAKSIFGTETPKPAAPSIFGNQSTTMQKNPEESAIAKPSIFGTQSAITEKKTDESAAPKTNIFGSTPGASGSVFNFGGQTPATQSKPPAAPSVSFGAAPKSGPTFSFGASNPQTNGGGSNKPDFQFGGLNASSAPAPSFSFGQDSSAGSSFTFTAGGATSQPVKNPFAGSSAASAAPTFGDNPPMQTPSSSFTFSFGQGAPSTPGAAPPSQGSAVFGSASNGANGVPSFNFTSATPSQSSKKAPSSESNVFGFLQAGGEGPAGASSPFPAPSSLGTTPVNGTPEPQSQNEDGEEAPQEQLSLTDGGPGEEDEVLLHEVRAKAIKYVPVKPDDEDVGKKSPWTTQGVGPLRVLKNKGTGTVRILLRAEPRGHIAMNKTILADIEYKATQKTLSFATASDDGSCLETWVVQVKNAEMATELAGVLEANKNANKKN